MIRAFLIGTVSSIALASAAFASDLPNTKGEAPYIPPPPPVFSWTGFYVGGNGGYGGDRFVYPFSISVPDPTAYGSISETSSGFLGGGQVGFNYQFPTTNYVVGIEADADATSIRGQLAGNVTAGGTTFSAEGGSHINYIGTVRGRLGYAFGNILPYVTGGFAYGSVTAYGNANVTLPFTTFGVGASQTDTRTGWTAGAGIEYAITHNLTFKTEYLYVNLGQNTLASGSFGPAFTEAPISYYLGQKTDAHIVRAGLNWKFDWFAPPVPVVARD